KIIPKISNLSFDLRYISDMAMKTPDCLRSDLGELNYPVPEVIRQKLKELADQQIFSYAPTFGDPDLLRAIRQFEEEKIKHFGSPAILVTSGGQAALFAALNSLLMPGDAILTDAIYYPPYANLARIAEAELINTSLETLDNARLSENIKVLLLNAPNNPTGKVYDQTTLVQLARLAREKDWIIIEDAVYSEIYFGEKPVSITAYCPERTLVINSASKNFCMPGMRIGWITGDESLISAIAKLHRNMNSCPNTLFQKVLAGFMPESTEYFSGLRIEMQKRRDAVMQLMDELHWYYQKPAGGIYLMCRVPGLTDTLGYAEKLIKDHGISLMPGLFFGKSEDQLRICFGALTMEEIAQFGKRLKYSLV
ncbi:MAG TPA: pyridoxal phosphate-dependent aminotransferase, partial [Saprospiraceae bacterium]|nr:pyridoxal phosphate-dependent aminotransferase [Saprospiraceae bacterium]